MNDSAYERFVERYAAGQVPWDDVLPPPEVVVVAALPVGRALDLGCGYGRTTIYLAQHGWQVDGVDFVPLAVAEATRRAEAFGVADKATFHAGSVTEMPYLQPAYQLAVDVGCMHALDEAGRRAYHAELCRLLEAGALYLLFARLQTPDETEGDGPRGVLETAVTDLFAHHFTLEKKEIGVTYVEDKSWQSGWFWFRRL